MVATKTYGVKVTEREGEGVERGERKRERERERERNLPQQGNYHRKETELISQSILRKSILLLPTYPYNTIASTTM